MSSQSNTAARTGEAAHTPIEGLDVLTSGRQLAEERDWIASPLHGLHSLRHRGVEFRVWVQRGDAFERHQRLAVVRAYVPPPCPASFGNVAVSVTVLYHRTPEEVCTWLREAIDQKVADEIASMKRELTRLENFQRTPTEGGAS